MRLFNLLATAAVATLAATAAIADSPPVGERHLLAANPTAALRDADHKADVRVTVWYPAAEGADEKSLDLGPPSQPLFYVGAAAPDAAFADTRRRPVILFSHGYGGSARRMAWFTTVPAPPGHVGVGSDEPRHKHVAQRTGAVSARC